MGSNPSPSGTPIEGKNWHQEVVTRSPAREAIRNEFYFKLARLRLSSDPDQVLDNPAASGLKTLQNLQGIPNFSRTVNPNAETFQKGKGWTLYECLNSYFEDQAGVTDPDVKRREVGLTLYYLTKQNAENGRPINVDYLNAGWTILIDNGRLYITDANGNYKVNGAYLRKPTEAPAVVTPVPDTVPAPQPRVVPPDPVVIQPAPVPQPATAQPSSSSTGPRRSAPVTPPPPASSRGPRTSAPVTPPRPSSGPRTSPPVSPPPSAQVPAFRPRTSPPAIPPQPLSPSSGPRTSAPATPPRPSQSPGSRTSPPATPPRRNRP